MLEQELAKYYDKLEAHDWFYGYSDRMTVVSRGGQEESRLLSEAKLDTSGEKMKLYDSFFNHMFNNGHKPLRPTGPKPQVNISDFGSKL